MTCPSLPRGNKRKRDLDKVKGPPPDNITIVTGPLHIAATRAFSEFVFGQKAQTFLHWIIGARIVDEEFFQSLNHSPKYGVPGAYRGKLSPITCLVVYHMVPVGLVVSSTASNDCLFAGHDADIHCLPVVVIKKDFLQTLKWIKA